MLALCAYSSNYTIFLINQHIMRANFHQKFVAKTGKPHRPKTRGGGESMILGQKIHGWTIAFWDIQSMFDWVLYHNIPGYGFLIRLLGNVDLRVLFLHWDVDFAWGFAWGVSCIGMWRKKSQGVEEMCSLGRQNCHFTSTWKINT